MQLIAVMCRSVWWGVRRHRRHRRRCRRRGGGPGCPGPFITGAWQLTAGILLLVALLLAPGGVGVRRAA